MPVQAPYEEKGKQAYESRILKKFCGNQLLYQSLCFYTKMLFLPWKVVNDWNTLMHNLVMIHWCHNSGQVIRGWLTHSLGGAGYKYRLTPWDSSDTGEEPRWRHQKPSFVTRLLPRDLPTFIHPPDDQSSPIRRGSLGQKGKNNKVMGGEVDRYLEQVAEWSPS